MKRVCFDIASGYFHNPVHGFLNDPSQARAYFQNKQRDFYAATTFDSSNREFTDFTNYEELCDYLARADEIITFNGRTYDLIVLENLVGPEAMRSVWRKPHHDLRGWRGKYSLKDAVSEFLPNLADSFDSVKSDRLAEICTPFNTWIAGHLADTYRDGKFTFALFQRYLASGDSEYTFHDD